VRPAGCNGSTNGRNPATTGRTEPSGGGSAAGRRGLEGARSTTTPSSRWPSSSIPCGRLCRPWGSLKKRYWFRVGPDLRGRSAAVSQVPRS